MDGGSPSLRPLTCPKGLTMPDVRERADLPSATAGIDSDLTVSHAETQSHGDDERGEQDVRQLTLHGLQPPPVAEHGQ